MKFYDTNILLHKQNQCFKEPFIISDQTLLEIESIKTSSHKDEATKAQAREVTRLLNKYRNIYEVVITSEEMIKQAASASLLNTPDGIICAAAKSLNIKDLVFETNDLSCRLIAENIFGLNVIYPDDNKKETYTGFKVINANSPQFVAICESPEVNILDCLRGQYVMVEDGNCEIVKSYLWDGNKYNDINNYSTYFVSKMFGRIKALDAYQRCAFDSLLNNDITVLFGRAGSGKTTIPLSYIFDGMEKGKFSRFHIIYHYEPLKGAKTLGFEKGTHEEKLINSAAIGNILATKFGDMAIVESMISDGTINIIPTANLRGVELGGNNEVVFVTEAQDLDTYTLKTIIQRCKSGCKQIYEGDILEQSDLKTNDIGIFKMIDVFKGHKGFGCVKLKNNYRSEFCELADKMI